MIAINFPRFCIVSIVIFSDGFSTLVLHEIIMDRSSKENAILMKYFLYEILITNPKCNVVRFRFSLS